MSACRFQPRARFTYGASAEASRWLLGGYDLDPALLRAHPLQLVDQRGQSHGPGRVGGGAHDVVDALEADPDVQPREDDEQRVPAPGARSRVRECREQHDTARTASPCRETFEPICESTTQVSSVPSAVDRGGGPDGAPVAGHQEEDGHREQERQRQPSRAPSAACPRTGTATTTATTTSDGRQPQRVRPGAPLVQEQRGGDDPEEQPGDRARRRREPRQRRGDPGLRPPLRSASGAASRRRRRPHRARTSCRARTSPGPTGRCTGTRTPRPASTPPGCGPRGTRTRTSAVSAEETVPATIIVVPDTEHRHQVRRHHAVRDRVHARRTRRGCTPDRGGGPTNSAQASCAAMSPPLFAKKKNQRRCTAAATAVVSRTGWRRRRLRIELSAPSPPPVAWAGDPDRAAPGGRTGLGPCRLSGGHCDSPRPRPGLPNRPCTARPHPYSEGRVPAPDRCLSGR